MYRLILFSILLAFCCNTPERKLISEQASDSLVNSMRKNVMSYVDQLNFGPAIKYLDSIGSHITQSGDIFLLSGWLNLKGEVLMHNQQYDSAAYYARQVHHLARPINSFNRNLIDAKSTLMNIFAIQKRYDSALIYGLDAYQLSKKTGAYSIAKVCTFLSETYFKMGDTANRRKYVFEGYQSATDPDNKLVLANNIAIYYFEKNRMDSGILFHRKVMADSLFKNNLRYQCTLTANMGTLLSSIGQLKEGLSYLKEALNICKDNINSYEKIYMNIAYNYFLLNQINQSNLYYDTALAIATSKNNYLIVSDAFAFLSENKLAQNRIKEAYYDKDSSYFYHSKDDSISFIEKAQELETRYAVKAKDEEITSLAFQNRVNQKIRNQQKIIIVTMIIAMLLLVTIGILLWRRRQIKTRLHESELQQLVLRNQIDPHFIANALSVLQGFIRSIDTKRAIVYNLQLARLLRLSFEIAGKSFVPLKDEIDFLNKYLSLQKIHWENKFDYDIDVYPSYEKDNLLIPPMILQPFIENAVMHAFANLDYKGMIIVKVARGVHSLRCVVEDNGIGLQETEPGTTKRTHSIAVTEQRLILLSRRTGKQATLDITEKSKTGEGPGVRVTVEIPFLNAD